MKYLNNFRQYFSVHSLAQASRNTDPNKNMQISGGLPENNKTLLHITISVSTLLLTFDQV
jgi:hypothetical protein